MLKAKAFSEKKICETALRLTARHGWNKLSLEQIAKTAKMPLSQVQKYFAQKENILPAIVNEIDKQTAANLGTINSKSPPHDRLFEVMMARFDVLQNYRAGIINIMSAVRHDPKLLPHLLPAEWHSMQKMLDLAHIDVQGGQQILAVTGLLGIYACTLCCWQRDQTADMAKTMATLDRCLQQISKLANTFFRVQ